MKVSCVTETLAAVSGGVRVIIEHLNRLRDMGHETACYVTKQLGWMMIEPRFPIYPVDLLNVHSQEVVFSPYTPTAGLVASCRAPHKYYYVHSYEPWFPRPRGSGWKETSEASYRLPLRIFCTSRYLKIILELIYDRRTIDVTVPGGVDHNFFRPLPRDGRDVRVFVIDRSIDPFRGVREAVEAVRIVQREFPNVLLVMTGGSGTPSFASGVRLEYIHQNSQEEYAKAVGGCDIFLHTSWLEGFPLTILESMACGLAVIATPIGTQDLCFDGYNSLMVPSRNIPATATALRMLVKDKGYRGDLAERGYETSLEYTWDRSTKRFLAAIQEGIERGEELLQSVDHFGREY